MDSKGLMSIPEDIDGLLREIKGQEVQDGSVIDIEKLVSGQPKKKQAQIPMDAAPATEMDGLWEAFLNYGNSYAYRVKIPERKVYGIDLDICSTLKGLDINKMSVANMINAILRAFIEGNKEKLIKYYKHTDSLL